jgi:hypothetical protein
MQLGIELWLDVLLAWRGEDMLQIKGMLSICKIAASD